MLRISCIALAGTIVVAAAQAEYSGSVEAAYSQFATVTSDSYTDLLPQELDVFSAEACGEGTSSATSEIGPFWVRASGQADACGASKVTSALSSFWSTPLDFAGCVSYPGHPVQYQFIVTVNTALSGNPVPGTFVQSTSQIFANIDVDHPGGLDLHSGNGLILNSPFDHIVDYTGFLAGLPEAGGTVDVLVPIELFTNGPDDTIVDLHLRAQANTMSMALPGADAFLEISVNMVDSDGDGVLDTCVGGLIGDANCDGVVNFGDINPFVDAILGGEPCALENLDINSDGEINFGDINPFVDLLVG